MYYECHITVKPSTNDRSDLKDLLDKVDWKHSKITNDPDLGYAVWAYATKHYPASKQINKVIEKMNEIASLLKYEGFTVVREKVELVIYDTKGLV